MRTSEHLFFEESMCTIIVSSDMQYAPRSTKPAGQREAVVRAVNEKHNNFQVLRFQIFQKRRERRREKETETERQRERQRQREIDRERERERVNSLAR